MVLMRRAIDYLHPPIVPAPRHWCKSAVMRGRDGGAIHRGSDHQAADGDPPKEAAATLLARYKLQKSFPPRLCSIVTIPLEIIALDDCRHPYPRRSARRWQWRVGAFGQPQYLCQSVPSRSAKPEATTNQALSMIGRLAIGPQMGRRYATGTLQTAINRSDATFLDCDNSSGDNPSR